MYAFLNTKDDILINVCQCLSFYIIPCVQYSQVYTPPQIIIAVVCMHRNSLCIIIQVFCSNCIALKVEQTKKLMAGSQKTNKKFSTNNLIHCTESPTSVLVAAVNSSTERIT